MTRYITVPKNKDAEKRLDFNEATTDELLELKIEDADFNRLWQSGIFTAINKMVARCSRSSARHLEYRIKSRFVNPPIPVQNRETHFEKWVS